MLKSLFDSLEDPNRPYLGLNYKLLKIAGFFPSKNKFLRLFHKFWLELGTVFLSGVFLEFFAVRTDVESAINNIKITTLGFICFSKVKIFVHGRNQLKNVVDYVSESDKYERMTSDETKGRIIDKYTKYCRRINYFYIGITYTTGVVLITSPFLIYVSSETLREGLRNGTTPFPHILSTWMPFDKNHYPGNWITVAYNIVAIVWGITVITAIDSVILVVMVFFRAKLELLRERCKYMLGTDGKGIPDDEANKIVGQIHETHMILVKHIKMFNTLTSPIMFTYVLSCSLMICASSYQLIIAKSMIEKFLITEYLIFAVAQLFLFCWFSSNVLEKNEELMLGPYESQWWAANARQRKSIMILAGQLSIDCPFTAGPFNQLTLNLFVSIIKGAYSFFTLLRK